MLFASNPPFAGGYRRYWARKSTTPGDGAAPKAAKFRAIGGG
jgi:hypothetical protein